MLREGSPPPPLMCHVSHVTCHMSRVTFETSRWWVYYQQGYPVQFKSFWVYIIVFCCLLLVIDALHMQNWIFSTGKCYDIKVQYCAEVKCIKCSSLNTLQKNLLEGRVLYLVVHLYSVLCSAVQQWAVFVFVHKWWFPQSQGCVRTNQ